jgi:hypothetical protein
MMAWTLFRRFEIRRLRGFPKGFGLPDWEACFACQSCWRPTYDDSKRPWKVWNRFVTHVSGGLLTGRDVKKPAGQGMWSETVRRTGPREIGPYEQEAIRVMRADAANVRERFKRRRMQRWRRRGEPETGKTAMVRPFLGVEKAIAEPVGLRREG